MTTSPSAANERHMCADHRVGVVAVRGLASTHSYQPTDRVVGDWLGELRDELRWHADHAGGVCDELESHIAERTRDLVLCGYGEEAAVRAALDELGEPRAMAKCYRRAQVQPARRYMMNASLFLLSGAALGLSIMAVASRPGSPVDPPPDVTTSRTIHIEPELVGNELKLRVSAPSAHRELVVSELTTQIDPLLRSLRSHKLANTLQNLSHPDASGGQGVVQTSTFDPPRSLPSEVAEKRITLTCKEEPLSAVLTMIAVLCQREAVVNWESINTTGADTDTPVTLDMRDRSADDIIRAISNLVSGDSGRRLAARADKNSLEFGSVEYFDQRETTLVSYDMSLLNNIDSDSLKDLLQTFVEPDGWKDQGGSMAWLKFAGPKMFVQAPKRYHTHIEWFLNELQAN